MVKGGQADSVCLDFFERFHKLLACLVVIHFVHAEHDASCSHEGGGDFLTVYQPEGTGCSFLYEIGGFVEYVFLYQQVLFGEMTGSDMFS